MRLLLDMDDDIMSQTNQCICTPDCMVVPCSTVLNVLLSSVCQKSSKREGAPISERVVDCCLDPSYHADVQLQLA